MDTNIIAVVLVTITLLIVALWVYMRRRHRIALQHRFGPEYERTLHAAGGPAKADAILEARAKRVEEFHITPLSASDRERFRQAWRGLQGVFVDDPRRAVTEADRLIVEVMRTQGYPVEADFDRRADDLSVHHAAVVQPYRATRDIVTRHQQGVATTEDLRQALVHFRELFDELVSSRTEPVMRGTRRAS